MTPITIQRWKHIDLTALGLGIDEIAVLLLTVAVY